MVKVTCPHCSDPFYIERGIEIKTENDAKLIADFISLRESERQLIINLIERLKK